MIMTEPRLARGILTTLVIVLFSTADVGAQTAPVTAKAVLPQWAARALQKSVETSRTLLAKPVAVSGVRGREFRSDELYWKMAGNSVKGLVDRGDEHYAANQGAEAKRAYMSAVTLGATGRFLERALLGMAVCDLAEGRTEEARVRLARLAERTRDDEIRVAATIQLAIAAAMGDDKPGATALLRTIEEKYQGHPLAPQASALLWVLESE